MLMRQADDHKQHDGGVLISPFSKRSESKCSFVYIQSLIVYLPVLTLPFMNDIVSVKED